MRAYEIPLGFKLNCQFKHLQPINRIAWSPDGNILAAPTNGQAIRLWDTQKCELLRTLQGHTGSVYCAAWSPDGSILASGSSDGTICLWNIETGECQRILSRNSENSDPVYTLSWSPDKDEMVLASNYSDGTILWDIHEGEPLRILSQPSTISDSAHIRALPPF